MSLQVNLLATTEVTKVTSEGLDSIVDNSLVFVESSSLSEGRSTFITLIRSGSDMSVEVFSQSSLCFEFLITLRTGERPQVRVRLSMSLDLRLAVEQGPALLTGVGLLGVLLHHVNIEVVLGVEHLPALLTGVLLVSVEVLQVMIIARGRLENCPTNLAWPDSCSVLFSLMFPQSTIIDCNKTTDRALLGWFA